MDPVPELVVVVGVGIEFATEQPIQRFGCAHRACDCTPNALLFGEQLGGRMESAEMGRRLTWR